MGSVAIPIPQGAHTVIVNSFEREKKKPFETDVERDDGQGNHDLPEELKRSLKNMLTHYGTTVDKIARRYEVIDARRQRFYDRGDQYIYWNGSSCVFLPITAGVVMSVGSDEVQTPRYTAVYNIFKPYRRNFCATFTQNAAGVNFEAKDPTSSIDSKTAECAEKYSIHYDQINEPKRLQSKIGRLMYTDGRVTLRTIHEKNGQKFGTFQEREQQHDFDDDQRQSVEAEEVQVEDELPNALADGQESEEQDDEEADNAAMKAEHDNARGEEVTYVYGVLENKVFPITATCQDELLGQIISDDPMVEAAKERYWWIADSIKAGQVSTGESAYERNARLGVLQGMKLWAQSADGYAHLTERQIMYLRPAAFRHDKENGKRLKKIFPDGVCVTFVSGEYAEAKHISQDDELVTDFPLDGDGMNRPSWGHDQRPVQDAYNNYRNMRQEFHDYCIPMVCYDQALIDPDALKEWTSQPGEWRGFQNPTPQTPMANYFFATQTITVPADLVEAEQDLRDALSQLVTAVQPSLFGGSVNPGSKDADRVGVYQMAREQAMGVLGVPWGVMQSMIAKAKGQAVLAAAKNRCEEDKLDVRKRRRFGKAKVISISIGDLKKGKFRAVPDQDSSFPSTRSQKKAALAEVFEASQTNPLLQEATLQPDNIELALEYEGLPEYDVPAARACNRQRDEIDQLLATGPIPPSPEQVLAAVAKAQIVANMAAATQAAKNGQAAPKGHAPLPPEMQPPSPQQLADPEFISSGAWINNPLMVSLAKCSLPPNKRDFHKYHIMDLADWFNSDERDKEVEAGNHAGLLNLELHWQMHEQFAQQDQGNQPQGKVSQSINFKDMPPEGKVQMAAEAGIKLNPATVAPPQVPPAGPAPGAQPAA